MLKTKKVDYYDGDVLLEGYCAYDDSHTGSLPAVLVVHDWSGRNDLACQKAEKLAELGYIGFAVDMYGKGKIGKTNEEKMTLMKPFMENRTALLKRITSALETITTFENVNPRKIGAIGLCFGGLCALDLARSHADVRGVVSFHGLLSAPKAPDGTIQTKILAIQGHDDPMVTPNDVLAFEKEMTEAHADWQFLTYGNTMHAFTNPLANDPAFGTVYNPIADKRSWIAMKSFFAEVLG